MAPTVRQLDRITDRATWFAIYTLDPNRTSNGAYHILAVTTASDTLSLYLRSAVHEPTETPIIVHLHPQQPSCDTVLHGQSNNIENETIANQLS